MEAKKQSKFVELRAAGQSYNKIANELSVSKSTLIKWSKEFSNDIKNEKALAMESIREEYLLGREHRLRVLGTQLNQITKEILKRDLTEVPTWRLYEIQRKVIYEIEKDPAEVKLSYEALLTPGDAVLRALRTTQSWTG